MSLRFVGGALRLTGARRAAFEIDTPTLPQPTVSVQVPTAAPEPAYLESCSAAPFPEPEPAVVAPEPEPAVVAPEPEPVVVEVPTVAPEPEPAVVAPEPPASEVEAPAEVAEAPAETGLVPENPPTE